MFERAAEYVPAFFFWIGQRLIDPAFIGTFLFFTIVIWIGMSGDDREPLSSFSRAGIIAFIAAVFIFSVVST
jgi:hypothetical protein